MLLFKEYALKLLRDYRNLLLKHLDKAAYQQKLEQLNLNQSLQKASEITLYEILHAVLDDLQSWAPIKTETASWHSGSEVFLNHLKSFLSQYSLTNQKLTHSTQNASRALVEVIQLISLPAERLTHEIASKIRHASQQIIHFGSSEQRQALIKALKKQLSHYDQLYRPLVEQFERTHPMHEDSIRL